MPDPFPPKIATAYLDGDFYDSIVIGLKSVWPRLSPKGITIIDDYADTERAPNAFTAAILHVDSMLQRISGTSPVPDGLDGP
ncbi:MAG: TylF/MycF/NovP-related O-methyltransferase [Actinomycetota bacterium]